MDVSRLLVAWLALADAVDGIETISSPHEGIQLASHKSELTDLAWYFKFAA